MWWCASGKMLMIEFLPLLILQSNGKVNVSNHETLKSYMSAVWLSPNRLLISAFSNNSMGKKL